MSYVRYNVWLTRQKVWTEEKLNWLIKSKEVYNDREDILNAFNTHFNTNITLKTLRHVSAIHKLYLPKAKRLLQKSLESSWISARGFTKKYIGDEISNGKATYIKTSNESKRRYDNYIVKQRYLYEHYHNVTLNTNDFIIFLNGDKKDFSKENLYKVSRCVCSALFGSKFHIENSFQTLSRIKYCEWKEKINLLNR